VLRGTNVNELEPEEDARGESLGKALVLLNHFFEI